MYYKKKMNNDEIIMFENTNINMSVIALNLLINLSFNIFSSSIFFSFI